MLSQGKCCLNLEEIQDDELQIHDYADDDEFEVIRWYYIRDSWCHLIQEDDWFIGVLDEQEARYMLCGEHLESVYGWAETCSPDCGKACAKVPERYNWLWPPICYKLRVQIGGL